MAKCVELLFYVYINIYLLMLLCFNINNDNLYKKINIYFIFPVKGKNGPSTLVKSYIKTIKLLALENKITKYFFLVVKNYISFENFKLLTNNSNNIIWFLFSDYFLKIKEYKFLFKNTVYGPMVSPKKWTKFPMANTYERNWTDYIKNIFSYVVQSKRVKIFLLNKSRKEKNIHNKYIISHGCMLINEKYNILKWNLRKYDILVYVKFADINKQKELNMLIRFLKSSYSIKIIRYGNHTKKSLLFYANNSKMVIYFSYYDCWPSSLMEMESMGAIPIVEQCEFINKYGYCIDNIASNLYYLNETIHNLLKVHINSLDVSNYYLKRNDCRYILRNTLFEIYYRKTNIYI